MRGGAWGGLCRRHTQNKHHLPHSTAPVLPGVRIHIPRAYILDGHPPFVSSPGTQVFLCICLECHIRPNSQSACWLPHSRDGHVGAFNYQEPHSLPAPGGDYNIIKEEKSQVTQRNPHSVPRCGQHRGPGLWDMLGAQVTIPR